MDPRADTQSNHELTGICSSMDRAFRDEKDSLKRQSDVQVPASSVLPKDTSLRKDTVCLSLLNVFILVKVPIHGLTAKNSEAGTANSSLWFQPMGCTHILTQSQEKSQERDHLKLSGIVKR